MTTTESERIAEQKQFEEEFKDLAIFNREAFATPERIEKCVQDHQRWMEDEKFSTMLWDPAMRKKRSYYDCKNSYGKSMADKIYRAKEENNGYLLDEDFTELINIINGKKPKAKAQKTKKPKEIKAELREHQKGDDYFLRTDRGLVRNESYRAIFKGPGTVYEWLWANIVREQWRDCKRYPIKKLYFDNGYLAYCSTYGQIGKACGMSKNTAHQYIKMFEKAGILQTKPIVPDGEKQGQTVFILGRWEKLNGEIVETFFRDSVFIIPQVVKN